LGDSALAVDILVALTNTLGLTELVSDALASRRVDEDASGLTFEEWDPSADTDASEAPVAMIINSSELRAAGFDLREVIPLQLEEAARRGQ
jgi:hypothetical protein